MKKILGLLAICTLVACNESGETAVAPVSGGNQNAYQDPNQQQVNADSIYQHVLDSINAAQAMSSAAIDPFSSSSVDFFLSSSAIMPLSSSSMVFPTVSSSSFAISSSSIAIVRSSSSAIVPKSSAAVDDGTITMELWDASELKPQVPVSNKKGGWWYGYDDSNNGGESAITWGGEPGTNGNMTPVLEACGGSLCGSYTLIVGTNEWQPFIGFAFGFGPDNKYSGDASAMLGVCVEYTSTAPIHLELGLTAAKEKTIDGGANAFYELPKSTAKKVVDLSWASFAPPEWATKVLSGAQSAKQLSSLKFKIQGEENAADGDPGEFAIYKVGPKGSCK